MATILPGSPPTFNRNDINGTVKALCAYIRSLQESVDFMLGQLKKGLDAAQASIEGLNAKTASLKTEVSGLQNSVATLDTQYSQLAARVAVLEQKNN